MERVTLEEVAGNGHYPIGDGDHGFIKPSMYKENGIPYIRVADIDWSGNINFEKMVYITEETHKANPKSFLYPGDIIIAKTGATIGKVAIIPDTIKTANTTSSIGKVTLDSSKAYNKYVLRYFQSEEFKKQMWRVSIKSAQPGFNIINLKKFTIPLPDLKTQQKIAGILEQADAARQKRKQANQLTEQFLQSAFLEMFGDPVRNEKGWEVKMIKELVKPDKIITYGIVQAGPNIENGIPYIKTGDIKNNIIVEDNLCKTSREIAESYERSAISTGDIVMSIRATVGTVALVPKSLEGANLTQGTARITPGNKLNNRFLFYSMQTDGIQSWIQRQVKGATFREITLQRLREMPIPIPPLPLQKKFATLVEQVEQLRVKQRESEKELENLFQSLMQRYFG